MRTWTFKTMTKMSSYPQNMGSFTNYVNKLMAFFWTTLPPLLTFSTLWMLPNRQHFWTSYPPPPPSFVNVVCERPYTNLAESHHPYIVGTYELCNLNLVRIWPQQNVVRVRLSSNMISRWHTQLAQQCSIENEIQNDQHFPSTSLFTWKVHRKP